MKSINKRVCIGIATKGRSSLLSEVLDWTGKQYSDIEIYVCATEKSDVPEGLEKRKDVVKSILAEKSSFRSVKNVDLDRSFQEIKKSGLSAQVIKMAKNINGCRMLISNG